MIGILQDPHFEYALARVKIRHSPINVQENRLDNFLGFAWIADDSKRHVENEMVIAVKESREGVLAANRHTLHKLFIGELEEVFGLQPNRLRETHFPSTSQISLGTQPRSTDSNLYNTIATLHSGIYFRSPWPISRPARAYFGMSSCRMLRPANNRVGQLFRRGKYRPPRVQRLNSGPLAKLNSLITRQLSFGRDRTPNFQAKPQILSALSVKMN